MKRRYWKLVISVLAVILLVAFCMGNSSSSTAGDVAGAVENTWNAAQGQIKQVVNIDNDEWFDYEPTAEESKLIKDMVAERIHRYHNETPQEFCQSVWDEGETEGPVMGGM